MYEYKITNLQKNFRIKKKIQKILDEIEEIYSIKQLKLKIFMGINTSKIINSEIIYKLRMQKIS